MRLIFHGLALGLLAILLSGCAGTRQYVPLPEQSKSVEDPSKGRLYVIRPALLGAAVTMNVSDSGKPIGRTGPRGYLCWERPPGEVVISGESEGVSALPVNVEAGQRYFFFQHVRTHNKHYFVSSLHFFSSRRILPRRAADAIPASSFSNFFYLLSSTGSSGLFLRLNRFIAIAIPSLKMVSTALAVRSSGLPCNPVESQRC